MTTAVGSVSSSVFSPSTTSAASPKQEMDGELFLQLLVTQLRTQDPSSPMDTNDMMGQMTQLASMEQLTAMASVGQENFALQMRIAAAALVGKEVSYLDAEGNAKTGVVSSVSFANGTPAVSVGSDTVSLDAVSGVTQSVPAASA